MVVLEVNVNNISGRNVMYTFVLISAFAFAFGVSASAMAKVKLWGSQGSRSPLVTWALAELNVEFELIPPRGLMKPANPHPFGQIPCLEDDGHVVFESGAILMYLADKYGDLDDPESRSEVAQWAVWANSSLDPVCFIENDRGGVIGTKANTENRVLRGLDDRLRKQSYLAGDGKKFTVADVACASYLYYVLLFFGAKGFAFDKYPNITKYMKLIIQRPAYRVAYPTETDGIQAIVERF